MNYLRSAEIVVWEDNGTYHIGNLLRLNKPVTERDGDKGTEGHNSYVLTELGGIRLSESIPRSDAVSVLIRHSKTVTETESVVESFVPWNKLYHYYGDKEGKEKLPPHHVSQKRYTDDALVQFRSKQGVEDTFAEQTFGLPSYVGNY